VHVLFIILQHISEININTFDVMPIEQQKNKNKKQGIHAKIGVAV